MHPHFKHGEARGGKSRLYRIWSGLRNRCTNPTNPDFLAYGGRGVTVHFEWNDYLVFREWANANGYEDNLSLDRIDNSGSYSPENCRWASAIEQNTNKRTNRLLAAFGESKTVSQWGRDPRLVVSYETFRKRIQKGWTCEEALTTLPTTNGYRLVRNGGSAAQEIG